MMGPKTEYRFKFFRAGGVDQVRLATGADLVALGELDQKLWVALSCPVKGLEFDERTLALVDTTNDGRVRAKELIAAAKWCGEVLDDLEILGKPGDTLPLAAIRKKTDEGKIILETARSLLGTIGKSEADSISVEDATAALEAFVKELENGDGIVPPEAIGDEELKALASELLALVPEKKLDKSGLAGFDKETVTSIFDVARALAAHRAEGNAPEILPLGAATANAFAALSDVQSKVEDFFARARIVEFDPRSAAALSRSEASFEAFGGVLLGAGAPELADYPLGKITDRASLPLDRGLNPAWKARVELFLEKTVTPILGARKELGEIEFRTIVEKLAAHAAWVARKPAHPLAALPEEKLALLVEKKVEERLLELCAKDLAAEAKASAIENVERLVRYRRDLLTLANNFVAFRDFYAPGTSAIFQVGTLYIDQRAASLCLQVNDAARHTTMAALSRMYLLYCDVKGPEGKTMQIAAAITAGDVDNLMVGRNGVFYDRRGRDWDATVTRIVEAPISVRQAFWSPYKKLIRLVEEQVSKRAAAAQAEADQNITKSATTIDAATKGDVQAAPAVPKKLDIGVVAALGVAVGGITAALGGLLGAFFGLGMWMPLGVLGLLLLISGPSMAIAWLKLRQRNIGPLLDANGWAVNVLAKVNIPLGRTLTSVAALPVNASRDLVDPFAEKKRPIWLYALQLLVLASAVLWFLGKVDRFLPERYRSTTVLESAAPANVKAPAAAPSAAASVPAAK